MTWSTTNASVATVSSNGLARGIAEGTAAITAAVSGVEGSQDLTVEFIECAIRLNVEMDPGGSATYEASDCLLLPPGVSGDRYRVAVIRPSESENPTDVTTATVKAMAIGGSLNAVAPPSGPAAVPTQTFRKIDGTVFVENYERRQQTARVHAILRQREREMGFSKETLLPTRSMLATALRVDPPETLSAGTRLH